MLSGSYVHTFQRHPAASVIMEIAGFSETSLLLATSHFVASPVEGQTFRYAYRLALLYYFVMFDTAGCVCVKIFRLFTVIV